jgi:RimJ/RimL family protein N-acetyltransferase
MARRIREADFADLDALNTLISDANKTYCEWAGDDWSPPDDGHERQHWREQIANPDAWAAVAEEGGTLVGCIDFMPAEIAVPSLAHLSRLFVTPNDWRSGIGSELCLKAIAEMRRRGFDRAELFAAVANSGARAFYERHGWKPTDETRDWHGLQLLRYKLAIGQQDVLATQTEPNRA